MNTRFTGAPYESDVRAARDLLRWLEDPHAALRSGACYGLSMLLHIDGVQDRLKRLEAEDTSLDVRLAAALVRHG